MTLETRLTSNWRNRMLFIALMIFSASAWFFYDGTVAWPAEARRYEAYRELGHELVASGEAPDLDAPEVELEWKKLARSRDWKEKVPSERTPESIAGQIQWGIGVAVVGVAFLGWVLWNQTLKIRSDDEFVYSARGKPVRWDAFTGMDRTKWEKKGIAVALYEENGKQGRLILDDYKFAPAVEIIEEIERRLGIVYKSPEDLEKEAAEQAASQETDTGEATEKKTD